MKALVPELEATGLRVNLHAPGEHVDSVERKIQTLNGTIRAVIHSLPYKLSIVLLTYCVYFATSRINLLTNKGNIQGVRFERR